MFFFVAQLKRTVNVWKSTKREADGSYSDHHAVLSDGV